MPHHDGPIDIRVIEQSWAVLGPPLRRGHGRAGGGAWAMTATRRGGGAGRRVYA